MTFAGLIVVIVQIYLQRTSPFSLLSANHLQSWSGSAENPLPAHTGQVEEEDGEGESLNKNHFHF